MTPRERAYSIVQKINDIRWPELQALIEEAIEGALQEERELMKKGKGRR